MPASRFLRVDPATLTCKADGVAQAPLFLKAVSAQFKVSGYPAAKDAGGNGRLRAESPQRDEFRNYDDANFEKVDKCPRTAKKFDPKRRTSSTTELQLLSAGCMRSVL